MKGHAQGWTLVEVLVSLTILTVLVVAMAEALNTTQRSWRSSRSAAERQQALDAASQVLSQRLRQATLQTRASYDTTLSQLVPASDLHFVSGPATELLTGISGVCGDAVFFQRPGEDGGLQGALHVCGFFVQYGGDDAWRPAFMTGGPARRRFRLLQFHQAASSLTLFQPVLVAGGPPRLSQITRRDDLYGWFAQPISDSSSFTSSVSVVAENVVAMIMQTSPLAQRCYDTRRYQWEAGSADAVASRHRLPQMADVTLVMVDETEWARLTADEAESLAVELIHFVQGQTWQAGAMPQGLEGLRVLLQGHRLTARVAVMSVTMEGG